MLVKQIGEKRVAWFGNCNQWMQFEEPAWFVYRLWVKGLVMEEIITKCCKKYGSDDAESRLFVHEIIQKLAGLKSPAQFFGDAYLVDLPESVFLKSPYVVRNYTILNHTLTFAFESSMLEYSIHPLLAHLETNESGKGEVYFELFKHRGKFAIRVTRDQAKTWLFDFPELQKGRVFIEILNTIYRKVETDWMTIVHGSAITDGRSTILFTAPCGGGKSTIAALLQAQGFQVVSDDMVPIDAKTGKIYPFPTPISVKEGAVVTLLPLYPDLENSQLFEYPAQSKQVRYLTFDHAPQKKGMINRAKALIFIRFDPTIDFQIETVSKLDAIKRFNNEAWVSSTPENARRYINWFIKLPVYQLTYSNNEKAVEAINQIFKGE